MSDILIMALPTLTSYNRCVSFMYAFGCVLRFVWGSAVRRMTVASQYLPRRFAASECIPCQVDYAWVYVSDLKVSCRVFLKQLAGCS